MSTRCQVQVVDEGLTWAQKVTLYHHTDGYPSYMLPKIQEAYQPSYEAGRAGKVAGFLCSVDPGIFEPEDSHELHGDIEYYYRLYLVNAKGGTVAEEPRWDIQVWETNGNPSLTNIGTVLIPRCPLSEAIEKLASLGDHDG